MRKNLSSLILFVTITSSVFTVEANAGCVKMNQFLSTSINCMNNQNGEFLCKDAIMNVPTCNSPYFVTSVVRNEPGLIREVRPPAAGFERTVSCTYLMSWRCCMPGRGCIRGSGSEFRASAVSSSCSTEPDDEIDLRVSSPDSSNESGAISAPGPMTPSMNLEK